jgi:hypothetical protein
MAVEKSQFYSIVFLVLFSLPMVFVMLPYLPIPADAFAALFLAALVAIGLRMVIKNDTILFALTLVSLILAPTARSDVVIVFDVHVVVDSVCIAYVISFLRFINTTACGLRHL